MELKPGLRFEPLPPIKEPVRLSPGAGSSPLGPLADLIGVWEGTGFNAIWRPTNSSEQDHFLELNLTKDSITFDEIPGEIPNRGLLQPDIVMRGLTYFQQISDANVGAALHIEPGIWAVVPPTAAPAEDLTVVRMASIPHGTAILAQGTVTIVQGGPNIPDNDITPFSVTNRAERFSFEETTLSTPTTFRSSADQLVGISQTMLDNPNSVLKASIAGQKITSTQILQVSTTSSPVAGGGTANTAFLIGSAAGPNAVAAQVEATFWIETVEGSPNFLQLQYSQVVLLNFKGLSWPHVSVGTLRKAS